MSRTLDYGIRPYVDADEEAVLRLLQESMGDGPAGRRTREFFRWKHIDNPFGRSYMILGVAGSELIGLRAFMRWEFRAGSAVFRAVRAVDTATHPDWRGRGIFSRLTLAALEELAADTDFVFNTPNGSSLPGYLKMGWQVVGRIPVWIRVARPMSMLAHAAGRTLDAQESPPPLSLSDPPATESDDRLSTPRSEQYLRWRYAEGPGFGYRQIRTNDGLAVYRVRPRGRFLEGTVTDVLTPDVRSARRLLRDVRRSARVDHVAVHAAQRTVVHRAARRAGFVRARGPVFVVRPLHEKLDPDPTAFESWSLSIGDAEVF